ncbi:Oligopeptide transport ATP-binding protein OppD (TC 3.A.1.5.1) [Patulibacter medicamentivorans]|jgi:peptide/nickel transport system ATP-binding protein|uniref:Oligopeptide transport ATP-binding protein OppD (TC 3.A.1.5.1) n=1 Tax=Patulibacter medicamentivorans TaxID=1097667 RepID=H0E346_9ACTN|nr:ABC transporter ATP-binding protein [Patulibacter medicamentivorans]EHN11912.1 Oligopeptide transport ATP-binding protein OppD (TC 3.A.1.5.1) [Patulibacter medicamentivorans]
MTEPLLDVRDLRTAIPTEDGDVHAVNGVSFTVEPGKVLGVVGESGSGKSVTMLTLMGLTRRAGAQVSGEVLFGGRDLVTASDRELQRIRGNEIAMIFQDPLSSLHPFYRVGAQITEGIRAHRDVTKKQARARAIELLGLVGIPKPEQRVDDYPHEFSGGMRQRVMIAMALANDPKLLIADEPTTALDVTVQAQILALLERLQQELGMAVVMITHDLGVVAEIADDIVVMYAGRVVEQAPVEQLFRQPRHPYTWGLLRSIPRLDLPRDVDLVPIEGRPPSLIHLTGRCSFQPRCPYVGGCCGEQDPTLDAVAGNEQHRVRCDMPEERRARVWDALSAGRSPSEAAAAVGITSAEEDAA